MGHLSQNPQNASTTPVCQTFCNKNVSHEHIFGTSTVGEAWKRRDTQIRMFSCQNSLFQMCCAKSFSFSDFLYHILITVKHFAIWTVVHLEFFFILATWTQHLRLLAHPDILSCAFPSSIVHQSTCTQEMFKNWKNKSTSVKIRTSPMRLGHYWTMDMFKLC